MKLACSSLCRTVPEGFESVTEGKATVLSKGNSVFYNRAQVVNRDISIAVLRWFAQQNSETKKKKKKRRHGGGAKHVSSAPIKVSPSCAAPALVLLVLYGTAENCWLVWCS